MTRCACSLPLTSYYYGKQRQNQSTYKHNQRIFNYIDIKKKFTEMVRNLNFTRELYKLSRITRIGTRPRISTGPFDSNFHCWWTPRTAPPECPNPVHFLSSSTPEVSVVCWRSGSVPSFYHLGIPRPGSSGAFPECRTSTSRRSVLPREEFDRCSTLLCSRMNLEQFVLDLFRLGCRIRPNLKGKYKLLRPVRVSTSKNVNKKCTTVINTLKYY